MLPSPRTSFLALVQLIQLVPTSAQAQASDKITIYPITTVNKTKPSGYFADPYLIQNGGHGVWIAGTTHTYLNCDNALEPNCASGTHAVNLTYSASLLDQAKSNGTKICSWYNLQPHQTVSGRKKSWDAAVTVRVKQTTGNCSSEGKYWSIITHARPADLASSSGDDTPPTSWISDIILIGNLSNREGANYDGKYFRTPAPESQLYLIYQKLFNPPYDGVAALALDDPATIKAGSEPIFLLESDEGLNSQDYRVGNDSVKVIETGNIRAIGNKFVMAYSTGYYNRKTYKAGLAWSDTFLPAKNQFWRKVMKANPEHIYGSKGPNEALYLLQSDKDVAGWNFVGDQVLAPGVPTVANVGVNNSWVLSFAGYDPSDVEVQADGEYKGSRRPYFIKLNVNVPADKTVANATDEELQGWIAPLYG